MSVSLRQLVSHQLTGLLSRTRYQRALGVAQRTIEECAAMTGEADSYELCRAASVAVFRTGKTHDVAMPLDHTRIVDFDDPGLALEITCKAWLHRGDACIGLCYEALGGEGKMTKVNLEKARSHRKAAASSEWNRRIVFGVTLTRPHSHFAGYEFYSQFAELPWGNLNIDIKPTSEEYMAKLNATFRARLLDHVGACKEDA